MPLLKQKIVIEQLQSQLLLGLVESAVLCVYLKVQTKVNTLHSSCPLICNICFKEKGNMLKDMTR
jgi:hypothetical protein